MGGLKRLIQSQVTLRSLTPEKFRFAEGLRWGFAPNPTRELSSLDLPFCFARVKESQQ